MTPPGSDPSQSEPGPGHHHPPAAERRKLASVAGHCGDEPTARSLREDPAGTVRAAALGALGRMGALTSDDLDTAAADDDPVVRRRSAELGATNAAPDLVAMLGDCDPLVIEAACWALGERHDAGGRAGAEAATEEANAVVAALGALGSHDDPRCREASVAALGAIGHPGGLAHVLALLGDKPAVRRRAIVALAAFEGPEVVAALESAMDDRDWQVRQAAEDVLGRDR